MDKKRLITLTIAEFNRTMVDNVAYVAHPECPRGRIILTGATGLSETDNSCVAVAKAAGIDITGDTEIGRWVNISSGAMLWTHAHPMKGRQPLLVMEMDNPQGFTIPMNKKICDDVWIFSSIILPQCQMIAKGVVVGAGSVVTKSIDEEYSIWAGNPARKVGMR